MTSLPREKNAERFVPKISLLNQNQDIITYSTIKYHSYNSCTACTVTGTFKVENHEISLRLNLRIAEHAILLILGVNHPE